MSTRNRSGRNTNVTSVVRGNVRRRVVLSAAGAAVAACLAPIASSAATTDVWTGASGVDTNWGTSGNWITTNATGIPTTDDLLSFNSSTNLISTDNITGLVIDGLGFGSGANAYTLNGSTPLTLDNVYENAAGTAFTGGYITNGSAANQTINVPVTFTGGSHSITTTAGSGSLSFGGTVATSAGTSVQFNSAGGAIGFAGSALSTTNGILGWATIGNSLATLNGSGNVVAYTGATIQTSSFTAVTSTNYKFAANTGTTASPTLITAQSGGSYADINSFVYAPASAGTEVIESATASIPIRLGAQGVIMNSNGAAGAIQFGGGANYSLTAGGANNTNGNIYLADLTVAGAQNTGGNVAINEKIVDNGTGHVSVTTYGSVNFAAITNTYSGGTYITGGDAYVNNGVLGTGPVYVYSGGRADYGNNNNATVANNFFIEGYGFVSGSTNNPGAIKGAYKGIIAGNITLLNNASIDPNSGTAYSTISGTISGNGSLTIGGTNSGLVGGAITLGGTLSYTGDTIIDNTANKAAMGINISSGVNNIMPNGSSSGNLVIIGGGSQATTFQLDGTTQTINGLSTPSGTVTNAIVTSGVAGGQLTLGGNNATAVFNGNITGTANLSLIKVGNGTQTLGGVNSYTGNTTINGGTLSVTGSLASANVSISGGVLAGTGTVAGVVTLGSGGINPGSLGAGSIGTLTLNSGLTVNGGNFGFDLGATTSDLLIVNGAAINFAGASTLTPSGGTPGSSYTVMTGAMSGSAVPTLIEPSASSRFSYSYDPASYNGINGGTSLVIDVNGQTGNLTWNNSAGGDGIHWDVVGQQNWTSNATVGNPNQFYQGDNVTFNDSNNGHYNVVLNTAVNPGSITVSTNGAYSISGTGTIGGTAALNITSPSGTGSFALSTSNSYSGGTTLNSGTLYINNANALGAGTLNINGGTIDSTSSTPITLSSIPQTWSNSFTFAGTQNLSLGGGTVTLAASPVVTVATNTLTVAGSITGAGQSLTKTGNGTLMLTGLSNYSGGTNVNGGTLILAGSSGGTGTVIGTLNINAGATVVASVINAFGYNAGTSITNVNINGGLLNDTATGDLGWGIAYVLTGGTILNNGGVSNTAGASDFAFGGPGGQDTSVTTLASSTTSVIAGRINIRNDNNQPNATFTVAQGNVTGGPTPGVDLLVSAGISQFANGLGIILQGNGVTSFTGANSYTGATNISGGTLTVSTLAAGGVASPIGASTNAAANLILNGGTLQYTGPAQSTDRLFTLLPSGGALDASGTGPINFTNAAQVAVINSGNRTLTLTGTNTGGNILASGITDSQSNDGSQTSVVKTGAGSWTLGGSNTYTGSTIVNQGILTLGTTGSIASGGAQVNGGKFNVNGTINSAVTVNSGGTLSGSGMVNGMVNIANGGALTGGSSGVGTLSLPGGLTLGTNSGDTETINAFTNATSPSTPSINVSSNNVTVNGNPHSVVINVGQTGTLSVGEYALLSYGNGSIAGAGTAGFTLGTLPARVVGNLDFNYAAGSVIDLNVTAIDFPVWTGAKDGTWVTSPAVTTGQPDNWVLNSNNLTATDFVQGDSVLFNDIAASGNVNIASGNVQPSVVTFNNSSVAYNVSSSGGYGIAGSTALTKTGSAAVTISTANSYTGGTNLLAGTLNINNAGALGTGTLNISGGSFDNTSAAPITLATNNSQVWSGSFTFNGTQSLNMGSGTVTLNANTTLNVTSSTLTVTGTIGNVSSGMSLTKGGAGTLILGGANTFSGGLIINAGTVLVTTNGGGATGLGGAPNSSGSPTIINTGGTLIGVGTDAFGYNSPNSAAPSSLNINGGTVTNLGTSNYRITLPDIQMTGGTLTSNGLNAGAGGNGQYSLFAGTVETNAAATTAVISAPTVSIQTQNVNGFAAFSVAQGTTPSGIDLLVSSSLINFGTLTNGLNKNGPGVMELSGSNTYTGGTTINQGTLAFASSGSLPAVGTLTIGGATAQILPHAANAIETVLTIPYLNSSGLVDLTNNAMIIVDGGGGISGLTSQVQQGYNGGAWNGTAGITSSTAAANSSHLTAVGVIINDNGSSQPLYGPGGTLAATFEGASPADGVVLLKYTYYGDTNLDGKVDGSDYSRVDSAYTYNLNNPGNPMTGWYNGDFNYDGVIDGSDYTLMDNAFNRQGSQFAASVASPTSEIAGVSATSAVPEPTVLTLGVVGCLGLIGRRRRRIISSR